MKKAVLISCFNWYKKRLRPIERLLCDNDYDVSIILSDFNHVTKEKFTEEIPNCTYIHVPPYKKNLSFARIKSHLFFGKQVAKFIEKEKPDLVYLLLPPNNTSKFCTQYKRKNPNTRLIIDIIDLWP